MQIWSFVSILAQRQYVRRWGFTDSTCC